MAFKSIESILAPLPWGFLFVGCWVDLRMNESKEKENIHHYMGIELNVQTWNLLDKEERSENDDKRMLFFAKASLYHWRKSPNYQHVNEQRGQWLVSHVLAILNRGEESLVHAKTCMDITMKESLKGFDLAYAYESKARAFAALGDSEKMNKCFINAKFAGEKIDGDKDRKLFFNDLYKDPWFKCIVE